MSEGPHTKVYAFTAAITEWFHQMGHSVADTELNERTGTCISCWEIAAL